MDEYFYSLPYVDLTGQVFGIVPVDESSPSRTPTSQAPSYETPWWVDTINRGIERAAQVATLEVAGYPPYPNYPLPTPQPTPMPAPLPGVTPQPQSPGSGIQLSQTTLMLLVGGVLLFMLGKRGR
jgi:hypothetical protein